MKSIVRFGQKALVMGAAIAGTYFGIGLNASVLALPQETVLEKLSPIPMFMLINDAGQPIFTTITDEEGRSSGVTGVFVSLADAQNLVTTRRAQAQQLLAEEQKKPNADPKVIEQLTKQSALWQEANILTIGLDGVYRFAQSVEAENLTFKFLPTSQQLNAAAQVIQQENFPGVPLFFLSMKTKDAQGNEVVSFPTMTTPTGESSGQIPVFFEVEPILSQLQGLEDTENLSINVMPLEVFLSKLLDNSLSSEEQKFLSAMTLVRTEEANQLIEQAKAQQSQLPAANTTENNTTDNPVNR